MRRLLLPVVLAVASALAVVAPAVTTLPGTAAAAAVTCEGRPATHAGSLDGTITGTPGPDVIVTRGARDVDAGGGDDLICITNDAGRVPKYRDDTGFPTVRAGDGDDVVLSPRSGRYVREVVVHLGAGRDRFTATRGSWEQVSADAAGVPGQSGTDGPDRIVVGTGDVVSTGSALLDDQIRLEGTATLELTARGMTARARIAGDGDGEIRFAEAPTSRRTPWLFDDTRGVATRGGRRVFAWTGVRSYELTTRGAPVDFRGGSGSDVVRSSFLRRADLGRGVDTVFLGRWPAGVGPAPARRVVGGPGRDVLWPDLDPVGGSLSVDAAAGRVRFLGSPERPLVIGGFEEYWLEAVRGLGFRGSDRGEKVITNTCGTVRVAAGGGNDQVLERKNPEVRGCAGDPVRFGDVEIDGGPGNDLLSGAEHWEVAYAGSDGVYRGGPGDDRIGGGTGSDRADGGPGRDVCDAEREVRCERNFAG